MFEKSEGKLAFILRMNTNNLQKTFPCFENELVEMLLTIESDNNIRLEIWTICFVVREEIGFLCFKWSKKVHRTS